MKLFEGRHHVGAWIVFLILAFQSIHTIPLRQRFFARLGDGVHSHALIVFYVSVMPLLSAASYVAFSTAAWRYKDGSRWQCPKLHVPGMLLQLAVCASLYWLDALGFLLLYPGRKLPGNDVTNIGFGLLVLLVTGFLAVSFDGISQARDAHARKAQEASYALEEARSRLLASQMDPHVYFNLMGNIRALMDFDPEGAKEMLGIAATYTRQVMEISQKPMISLGDERRMVLDYLEIQRIRLGANRCAIRWDWSERFDSIQLPPILIQPMVENAIKHGIWPNPDGGELGISARMDGSVLAVEVRNTGVLLDPKHPSSVGLSSIRQRLELAYGAAAKFRLASEGAWTIAEIHIPVGTCES